MKKIINILLLMLPVILFAQATKLKLLGHWRDPALKGSAQYDNTFNEAYGFVANGHEYGIIGSTFGTHIIDVTDPEHPYERMRIPGGTSSTEVIHRDFRYYKCHIYGVCDEGGGSTLQIIDVSRLPDTAILVYNKNDLFTRVHNIFIDESKARLYTSSEKGVTGYYALGLYDIRQPENPVYIGHYSVFGNITANHVHDCFVRNDTAYLNCGYDGMAIMDFSDAKNPKPLFTLKPNEYNYSGYNHSGWLTPDGKTYVMADETHGLPLKVFDLTDFSHAKVVSYLSVYGDSAKAIPHNPLLSCHYAYVAYYYDGLQVYDISNAKSPQLKYYYPTSTEVNYLNYKGAWGTYPFLPSGNIIVADMQNGMFIIEGPEKVCNPANICSTTATSVYSEHTSLALTPNPARDQVRIHSEKIISKLILITADGRFKYPAVQPAYDLSLDLSDMSVGFYVMEVQFADGGREQKKLIIAND